MRNFKFSFFLGFQALYNSMTRFSYFKGYIFFTSCKGLSDCLVFLDLYFLMLLLLPLFAFLPGFFLGPFIFLRRQWGAFPHLNGGYWNGFMRAFSHHLLKELELFLGEADWGYWTFTPISVLFCFFSRGIYPSSRVDFSLF